MTRKKERKKKLFKEITAGNCPDFVFKNYYIDAKVSRKPKNKHKEIHTQTHHGQATESKREKFKSSKSKTTHDTTGNNNMING